MKKIEGVILRDLWLKKYHNTSTEEILTTKPEEYWGNSNWFKDYKVTQEQYNEWVIEAKKLIKKETKCSESYLKQQFPWIDLQLGPSVIEKQE